MSVSQSNEDIMRKQSHRNSVLTLTRLLVVSWMIVGCSLVACSLITERKARYAEPTLRGETQAAWTLATSGVYRLRFDGTSDVARQMEGRSTDAGLPS